jgi:hypothetical protein
MELDGSLFQLATIWLLVSSSDFVERSDVSEERAISSCTGGSDCVVVFLDLRIVFVQVLFRFWPKGISEERVTSSHTGGSDRALWDLFLWTPPWMS